MLKSILEKSRYMVVIAVLGSLLGAVALLAVGIWDMVELAEKLIHEGFESKTVILGLIETIDGFLMATVFLIISVGLYELFIDDTLVLPEWLEIKSLNDLKAKLVGVVIIVLGVVFLGNAVKWSGGVEIVYLGGAVAAVIASLTLFLGKSK